MRMSQLFNLTLREAPGEAEVTSHQLLLRSGFIRQLAAGIFSYMPLAKRTITKIENIMREEINSIGGQEVTMPVVHPADIWKETQRWYQIGTEMGRFKDKAGRDMVLAMTHEEVVADLVRRDIRSYRQLPRLIYHIQTKWRDDPRPRAGLVRVREFTMKDSYSLDIDWEGLDKQYRAHYQAYFNIFHRCGLPVIAVKSDVGMMGGKLAHEYMYLTPIGEDTLIICDNCGYSANRQVSVIQKTPPVSEKVLPVEKIATPDMKTIEALANFLGLPESKTAKAVFMVATIPEGEKTLERFVFAVVRGDMELNETKLTNVLKAKELRPATEEEIQATGAVPGYASPVGLSNCLVVVDDLIPACTNLVSGANEEGYHLLNVNYERDYKAHLIADITATKDGDPCIKCQMPVRTVRGVEVGNIFKLGTRYSDAMGCTFLDKDGQEKPIIMGSYGIGSGRLLACVAEENNDENGLIWPISIAPYHVHLVILPGRTGTRVQDTADSLYDELCSMGVETLYDDREETPGVKFMDADLIGIPIRLTVSERSLEKGCIEFKRRDLNEKQLVSQTEITNKVLQEIKMLFSEIESGLKTMTFKD